MIGCIRLERDGLTLMGSIVRQTSMTPQGTIINIGMESVEKAELVFAQLRKGAGHHAFGETFGQNGSYVCRPVWGAVDGELR